MTKEELIERLDDIKSGSGRNLRERMSRSTARLHIRII